MSNSEKLHSFKGAKILDVAYRGFHWTHWDGKHMSRWAFAHIGLKYATDGSSNSITIWNLLSQITVYLLLD